ncbi:hypothetical protein GR160_12660 [Flavobacterium sp. Sd200]|uniref:hypothetical protein n=1 Tax=Flavobacterium sp. Sd200 TaxID=2692211 RepID=UPI001367F08F|nr:hypothetical protein [Flavobacterium sp. Sd200]MXN92079.1 hypothetical protein [Flavobacterium sp. Sd200]
MRKFISAFTYIFHPLFVPVYATLFYFLVAHSYFYKHEIYLVFLQVFILTILLPISLYYLLRSLGKIRSKVLLDKKERRLPLAFYSVLLLILIEHSFSVFVVPELYYYFLGVLISTVAALALVLAGFKSSLHMMAISSFTLFTIGISVYYHVRFINLIALLIMCCGLVASSRLQAKAHTMGELALGTLVGILPQVGLWYVWLLPSV